MLYTISKQEKGVGHPGRKQDEACGEVHLFPGLPKGLLNSNIGRPQGMCVPVCVGRGHEM